MPAVMVGTAIVPVQAQALPSPSPIYKSQFVDSPTVESPFFESKGFLDNVDEKMDTPPPPMAALTAPPPLRKAPFPTRPLVTIRRAHNRAPTLVLTRISDLNLISPFKSTFNRLSGRSSSSPATPSESLYVNDTEKQRPHSAMYLSTSYTPSFGFDADTPFIISTPPQALLEGGRLARHTMAAGPRPDYARHRPRRSSLTLPHDTVRSSTVSDVVVVQFPGIPPRITPKSRQSTIEDALKLMEAEEELYPVVGVKRTPSDHSVRSGLVRRSSSVKRKPVPRKAEASEALVPEEDPTDAVPPLPESAVRPAYYTQLPPTPVSPDINPRRYTSPDTQDRNDFEDNTYSAGRSKERARSEDGHLPMRDDSDIRAGHARIKSVGSVSHRRTPLPTPAFSRASAVAEWFNLPKADNANAGERAEIGTIVSLEERKSVGSGSDMGAGESFFDYR